MNTVFIYALCEPGTRKVRYIGMTGNLKRRLRQHRSKSLGAKTLLGDWLRSLGGCIPNMIKLCETSEAFWQDEEARYIRAARALGMPLVNSTDGGEGCCNPSSETRVKMSASAKKVWEDPEARARISAQKKQLWTDPAYAANMRALRKAEREDPVVSARWRAGNKAGKSTPEARAANSARIKATMNGPKGPELKASLSASLTAYQAIPEVKAANRAQALARYEGPKGKELRARLSAAFKGKPWSVARRAAHERKKAGGG